jgi:hypothetical protein
LKTQDSSSWLESSRRDSKSLKGAKSNKNAIGGRAGGFTNFVVVVVVFITQWRLIATTSHRTLTPIHYGDP